MAVMLAGSKNLNSGNRPQGQAVTVGEDTNQGRGQVQGGRAWAEILIAFMLLESILWTPRSLWHALLVVVAGASVLWFTLRSGYSRRELGLKWPSRPGTWLILGTGSMGAVAIPLVALATGHTVPANPNWPEAAALWPYPIWAFLQQFLLQSFFFLRFETLLGARRALVANTLLFTVAHLPNLTLSGMTFFGALFFTEMFRRYRSIYPLAIAHALLGIAIAYSFPDSIMRHMRVGLGFWTFR
jgi:membrane protease YdiL (CAAX protease family)